MSPGVSTLILTNRLNKLSLHTWNWMSVGLFTVLNPLSLALRELLSYGYCLWLKVLAQSLLCYCHALLQLHFRRTLLVVCKGKWLAPQRCCCCWLLNLCPVSKVRFQLLVARHPFFTLDCTVCIYFANLIMPTWRGWDNAHRNTALNVDITGILWFLQKAVAKGRVKSYC